MAKTAFITGAAKRLGAHITNVLHQHGFDVIIHYHQSQQQAEQQVATLNQRRPHSATCLQADLTQPDAVRQLAAQVLELAPQLDVLINNASHFAPRSLADTTDSDWDKLIGTNLRAPFLLAQQLAPALQARQGCIINLVDIYAEKPLLGFPLYSIAKAGLVMLTQSLARELAPHVRVNAIAPGVILAPTDNPDRLTRLLPTIPLGTAGQTDDIADALLWLATRASYTTGQIIKVDGGRSLAFAEG